MRAYPVLFVVATILFTGHSADTCFRSTEFNFDRFTCCKEILIEDDGFQLSCKVQQDRENEHSSKEHRIPRKDGGTQDVEEPDPGNISSLLDFGVLNGDSDYFDSVTTTYDLVVRYTYSSSVPILKIDCRTATPAVPSLLAQLSVERVVAVEYASCELPRGNLSFSEMFDGNQAAIRDFTLTEPRNCTNCVLRRLLFDGIASKIEALFIESEDRTLHLSDDFFGDFATLQQLRLRARSTSLPSSMGNLSKLSVLDISDNDVDEISSRSFSGMGALKSLTMMMFPAKKISTRPFAGLKNLEILKLEALLVSDVAEDLLYGLHKLSRLEISRWNNLKGFPQKLLENTPKLTVFSLYSMPQFETLPEGFFRKLSKLKSAYIIGDDCGFETLPPNMWPVENLREVTISRTALRRLPGGFFPTGNQVRTLILRHNQLLEVEDGLKNLKHLASLVLRGNRLTSISATFFENLSNLNSVDLSYNRIVSVDYRAFMKLHHLQDLGLDHNYIGKLYASEPVFPERSALMAIDLSSNNLTEVPRWQLECLKHFYMLNLDNNFITSFEVTRFLSSKTEVTLRNNRIEIISVKSIIFEGVSGHGTHDFLIENNPIKCTGENFEFFRYVQGGMKPELADFKDVRNCFCSETKEQFLEVHLENLHSRYEPGCPASICNCSFFPLDKFIKVHCGNRGLSVLPELPINVTHLIFNENSLNTYPIGLSKYRALKVVNMDDNRIESIDSLLDNVPEKLQELSLRQNRLKSWNPGRESLTIESLDLRDNPWICDCKAKDFKLFLQGNHQRIKNYRQLRCENPVKVNGETKTLLSDIAPEDLCPIKNTTSMILGVSAVIVFAILFLITVLYFKNRNLVIAFIYVHFHNVFVCFFREEDLDEDRKFDAFLSYSALDRDVAIEILHRLEIDSKANDNVGSPFSLCLHERDFVPGQTITWNILNSVQTSRRTILLLSKEFLESMWFKIEFQAAYDQMLEDHVNRLIIVIKGELPPLDTLNENLHAVLKTKTYLVWGERWFWKKLIYAMPHRSRTANMTHETACRNQEAETTAGRS